MSSASSDEFEIEFGLTKIKTINGAPLEQVLDWKGFRIDFNFASLSDTPEMMVLKNYRCSSPAARK